MMSQPEDPPATMLEAELRRRRWTREDCLRHLAATARRMNVRNYALGLRQLDRWITGQVHPRSVACRVAEETFGRPIEILLGPVTPRQPPGSETVTEPAATVAEYVADTGHSSRDHAAMSAAGAVGPATLEQLHAEVRRLAHAYASTPPLALLGQLMRTRDLAYELLSHTRRPAQLGALFLIAGQACGLAATTAFDLGYRDAADDHGRAAWTYGELIDNHPLRARARSVQATVAFWSGEPRLGLHYAASGLEYAQGQAAVRLQAIAARAWAMLGAAEEAHRALRGAAEERDRNPEGDELAEDIGGEFSFGPARHSLCAGAVYVTLGNGRAAASAAGEALRLFERAPAGQRRWAVEHGAWMDLATARVLQDDIDGAGEALTPAMHLDHGRRTARLAQRLATLRVAVDRSRYRNAPAARHIAERVDDFTAGSLLQSGRLALPAGR